jgi:hypothetical protein
VISGDGENIVINDFSQVVVNGKEKRFYSYTKGWVAAMQHFHSTPVLSESPKTPTLAVGLRNAELAFRMEEALN